METPHTDHNTRVQKDSASKKLGLITLGVILIVAGILSQGQAWTTPEMFRGLDLDLSKTIVNVGLFLLFIQVINIYFYTPLREAMEERSNQLESTFTEAEELRTRMETMRSDYERRLQATEAQAREQIQAQIKEAQNLRQQLMTEATAKADELVARAQQEIEQEKNRVMNELRIEVVNLSLTAAERVLGENMDSDKNRRLVTEFIEKVEVPG